MPGPRPAISRTKYQRYLASREWSVIRERVRERSGNRCEHCCSAPQQAVHHLTYENVGNERLGDLLAVCEPCHEFLSGKSTENPLEYCYVVSPRLDAGPHFIHLLVPVEGWMHRAEPPIHRYCDDDGCIWCGYGDETWPLFLEAVWMPA